ncbi:hypothetical protein CCACVL1_01757, partial [Corchorus capsularis]
VMRGVRLRFLLTSGWIDRAEMAFL